MKAASTVIIQFNKKLQQLHSEANTHIQTLQKEFGEALVPVIEKVYVDDVLSFPTTLPSRPAKAQISMRIREV